MPNYYIRQGATSGNGSMSTPYGSFTELLANVNLRSGDYVFISNISPILEGAVIFNGISGVTFDLWDEKLDGSKWNKWNAESASPLTLHATGASHLVYKTSTAVDENAINVTENWSTSDDGNGNRYGFLTLRANATALETARGYFIDGSDILYVSVPLGQNTTGREYLVCLPGHGIQLTNCTRCVFKNGVVGLTTQSGNGNGYGIRVTGNSKYNRFINMEVDGCQFHGFGDVSNNPTHILTRFIFRSHIRGTDSQYVVFSSNGVVSNCVIDGAVFWPVPWLDVDGSPVSGSGGIKAIAAHHADNVNCRTDPRGIIFKNCVQKANTYLPSVHSFFCAIGNASSTNHVAPSDYDDVDTYPIIVRDCVVTGAVQLGGGGKGSGNHQVNNTHIAFERTRFYFDGSNSSLANTSYGGFISTENSADDADINCVCLLESCVVAGSINETSTTRLVVNRANGAELRVKNCTLMINGTTTATQRLIGVYFSMGFLALENNIFDTEDSGNQLMAGGGVSLGWLMDSDLVRIRNNLYSTNLNNTFQASFGINRASWASNVDPTGKYDANPVFLNTTGLELDDTGKAWLNTGATVGSVGINQRAYSYNFGAYQYGNYIYQNYPWGTSSLRTNSPNYLTVEERKSAVLTERGWEIRSPGNGDPAAMEVLVTGNFGTSGGQTNQSPEVYEGSFPITEILVGVSGSEIEPYFIEVSDPDAGIEKDIIRVYSYSGFTDGLVVQKVSTPTSPVCMFKITGTPTESGEDIGYITFADSAGSLLGITIAYNISG